MVGKIKVQDAVDDYDWIKCARCQKSFPKRDYIIHRQEHKKGNNGNNRLVGGDSGKRLGDNGERIVEKNVNFVRSSGVTRQPGINPGGNRPNIIIKREIPVVTLSSDDDEENAEINDENLPSDIHIRSTTTATTTTIPTSTTSDSSGSAVQNSRQSELAGSVNSASIPVSVIVERFSEIGGQQRRDEAIEGQQRGDEAIGGQPRADEAAEIVQNAKNNSAILLESEVPNVEVSTGKSTGPVSKLYKRLQRPGPLSWKKSLERKVSKEKSPAISSTLDQPLRCQMCKEVFRTEEELSSHMTKCRQPESPESKSENSAVILNNQNPCELRPSCGNQIEDKGQDDTGRLVVVLRRMSEDDPVTGEKGEYQCVDRNNSNQVVLPVAMPSKKPRKKSVESRIQLMKDIQPYVRRAAACKPIRYEENVCPYCDKIFSSYNMVEMHIKKKHEDRGDEIIKSSAVSPKCVGTSCSNISANSALLVAPPNLPQARPFRGKEKCEQCGRFFTAKQMIRHALFHAKKKPYKCTSCQKCFVSIAGKRGHQNKCRQYSLAFLPNGEWKRVPFKVSRNATSSSVNYKPSAPGKFNNIAVNIAIKTRGRRRKSRPQHAAAKRSSPVVVDGIRESLIEAGTQRDRNTEEKHNNNIEQATKKEKIQSPIPQKPGASDKPVPMPTKLAKSDLTADYTTGVGKRILELLKQLDKAAAATKSNNATVHRRKSETAGTPICWIVKEGQKSISCSLFTRTTTEGTTGKFLCQGRSLSSSSSLSDPDTLDCDFCSLKLAPAEYLHHVLQHEDCSAYTCPVCLKIYLHSGLYKRHMRLMHGQSGNTRNNESNHYSNNNNVTLENHSSSTAVLFDPTTGTSRKVSRNFIERNTMLKRQ